MVVAAPLTVRDRRYLERWLAVSFLEPRRHRAGPLELGGRAASRRAGCNTRVVSEDRLRSLSQLIALAGVFVTSVGTLLDWPIGARIVGLCAAAVALPVFAVLVVRLLRRQRAAPSGGSD